MKTEDLHQTMKVTFSYEEAELLWCVLHDYLQNRKPTDPEEKLAVKIYESLDEYINT